MIYSIKHCHSLLLRIPDVRQFASVIDELFKSTDSVSLLCYDIQSLRKINRAYGRNVGGTLLAAIADWVKTHLDGQLFRIEGDHFCLLFKNTNLDTLQNCAYALEDRFRNPWELIVGQEDYNLFVQASIAIFNEVEENHVDELLELMEQALSISKDKHEVIQFTAEYNKKTLEQVQLQLELKNCILSDMRGFHLEYQPFVNPVTRTWVGFETLCRWAGPTIGKVSPEVFIVEIEEMGLIHLVGSWVLNTAIATCKSMGLDAIDQFFVSVNVSAMQMNRSDFVETVMNILDTHQYPPEKLMLELTESAHFSFDKHVIDAINFLRAKGVRFALDDFGSGCSGFSSFKNLPADMLKMDRDFTENIESDKSLQYFYYVISETAHAHQMKLIAEGIETEAQLMSVMKNGADIIQGYFFSKPITIEEIVEHKENFFTPLHNFNGSELNMLSLNQWMSSQNAYMITPALFGLQSKCIDHVWQEKSVEDALYKIMETVGSHFNVSRVYVFMREQDTIFNETCEWCVEGVATQIDLFQQMDGATDGFLNLLRMQDVVFATKEQQLPDNLVKRLEESGHRGEVQSIVAMPMKQNGEILGFVGYDSVYERTWLPEELIILHNICLLCLIALRS
ncbi:diguanylate cyclase (GGDEF)-like protein [Clostridiales Family XIII bacterium PM5-7]